MEALRTPVEVAPLMSALPDERCTDPVAVVGRHARVIPAMGRDGTEVAPTDGGHHAASYLGSNWAPVLALSHDSRSHRQLGLRHFARPGHRS